MFDFGENFQILSDQPHPNSIEKGERCQIDALCREKSNLMQFLILKSWQR